MFGFGKKGKWRTIRKDYADLPESEWTDDEYDHWFQSLSDDEAWAHWEKWSRQTAAHPTIKKIKRSCLDMALESAKGSFPLEFAALLRVMGDTVTEMLLMPGTIQGDEHAIFSTYMRPVDSTIRGTLHSHPDPHPYPSDADVELFGKEGEVHLILGEPYGPDDWRAYDYMGHPIHLEVV